VLISAFDFPVPKTEFVNQMRQTNDMTLNDLPLLYNDVVTRQDVLDGVGMPTRPGALAKVSPPRPANDVYRTDLTLIFYDDPTFGPYNGWLDGIMNQPRYTDLAANLRSFTARYQAVLDDRKPLSWWQENRPDLAGQPDFSAFYNDYYQQIGQSAAVAKTQLATLTARPVLAQK
jgi:hypothetical protein